MEVNLFDFDNTLYPGDCSFDFYVYCLRARPQIIRFLPLQVWHWTLYFLGAKDRVSVRSSFFCFLREMNDVEQHVQTFWRKNWHRIRMLDEERHEGKARIIISASPEFLLNPLAKKLNAHLVIATKVDIRTGMMLSRYCYGHEKVVRLLAEIDDVTVHEAYSDSLSDLPILRLADRAYMVKHHKVIPLEKYQRYSLIRRLLVSVL